MILGDRYALQDKLGQGGMGVVYVAHDQRLDRQVAVKVLKKLTADDDSVARFEQEAKAAAKVRHANVVEIYDFGETEDAFFIAMALLEGEDLGKRIRRGGMTWPEILEITGQMVEGVGAAHEAGLVHRDLKPANIFLSYPKRGGVRVHVLDFGVCTTAGPRGSGGGHVKTKTGIVVGTPAYLAPESYGEEQHSDVVRDRRRDTYAAGVMLYEMAAGRRPFDKPRELDLVLSILNDDPVPPSQVPGAIQIPPAVDDLILQTISRDPLERPHPITTIFEELHHRLGPLAGEPGLFSPASGSGRLNPTPPAQAPDPSIPIDVSGSGILEQAEVAGPPTTPFPSQQLDVEVAANPPTPGLVRPPDKRPHAPIATGETPYAPADTVPTPPSRRGPPADGPRPHRRWLALALAVVGLSFVVGVVLRQQTSTPQPRNDEAPRLAVVEPPPEPEPKPEREPKPIADPEPAPEPDPEPEAPDAPRVAAEAPDAPRDPAPKKPTRKRTKKPRATPAPDKPVETPKVPAATPPAPPPTKPPPPASIRPAPPSPVRVTIKAGPQGYGAAWIRIDGKVDGGGSPFKFQLRPGNYAVQWDDRDGKRHKTTLTVPDNAKKHTAWLDR